MKWIKGFLLNLQFFTSIPIRKELPLDSVHLGWSVKTFPLVGLIQGILYSLLLYSLQTWTPFSHLAIAFILLLFTIVFTGGIHLDGWMDVSDAYFSFRDKKKRLTIMADPHIGAFGVLSVILLLGSRFLFIFELVEKYTFLTLIFVALIPYFAKCVMGMVLVTVPAAKKEGLAALFQQSGKKKHLFYYVIYFCFIIAIFYEYFLLILLLTIASLLSFMFVRRKAEKWFGGITGDVLGATAEGTETLLWMIVWLLHYFVMV